MVVSKSSRWESRAEKWGISSDLWDLASLFQDLPGLLTRLDDPAARNYSPACTSGNANEAAWMEVTDLQQELQEAELRANEALKKRLETQVAILNDDISHMRQDLHNRASSTTPEKRSFVQVSR